MTYFYYWMHFLSFSVNSMVIIHNAYNADLLSKSMTHICRKIGMQLIHINWLMEEIHNSSANILQLHLLALTHRYGVFPWTDIMTFWLSMILPYAVNLAPCIRCLLSDVYTNSLATLPMKMAIFHLISIHSSILVVFSLSWVWADIFTHPGG